MTAPKFRAPDQMVELCRRTAHRQMLMRPGEDTRELAGYMFGKALLDCGQEATVACMMSNHYHSIQLDRDGRRSEFMQQFHSNTARKRNLQLRRRENLWAAAEPGDMVLLDVDTIVRKILYVCMQPVEAGCVEHPDEWTGFQILPHDWGKPMRFERPALCGSNMPEYVEFTPMPPACFRHLPLEEVIELFEDMVVEEAAILSSRRQGPVLGIDYCEAISPFSFPHTPSSMRTLNPKFAGKNKIRVVKALRRQQMFRHQHRDALNRYRQQSPVVFPAGTLQMARLAGVRCAQVSPNDPRITCNEWSPEMHKLWDDWQQRHQLASA